MTCVEIFSWPMNRDDRDYISWPIDPWPDGATATVELENDGVQHPLLYLDGELTGLFAGPNFSNPGSAVVVTTTSHCVVRIAVGDISVSLDGGFIELIG